MKLAGRDAARFLARPDTGVAAVLLFGPDPMRVALKRAALVAALIGERGAGEMRLTRLAGADLRRDPAAVSDAMRATGFFPGARVVLVHEAADAAAPALRVALDDWRPGDATLVAAAGNLGPGSALRKAFEAARSAVAIGVYADPPGRDEIEAALAANGLARPDREVFGEVEALAQGLDPGDFAQFLVKLALYKRGDADPLSAADLAACAPPPPEAEIDEVVALAADGAAGPLALAFRTLHAAAVAADGPEAALSRARPPVFGPRRARMAAQARALGESELEKALALIIEAELALRSSRPLPGQALVERLLVRLATLRRRRT